MKRPTRLYAYILLLLFILSACGRREDQETDTEKLVVGAGIAFQSEDGKNASSDITSMDIILTAADLEGMTEEVVSTIKDASVYAKPLSNASVIGAIDEGTNIGIYGLTEDEAWMVVSFNGRVGYVEADVFEREIVETQTVIVPTPQNTTNNQATNNNSSQTPSDNQAQNSGNGQSQNENNSESSNNNSQNSSEDGSQKPSQDSSEKPSGESNSSNNGNTDNPDNEDSQEPGEGNVQEPSDEDSQEPSGGDTKVPSAEDSQTPDSESGNGDTQEPGSGDTQEPNEGEEPPQSTEPPAEEEAEEGQ